jgi:hypothetical protein
MPPRQALAGSYAGRLRRGVGKGEGVIFPRDRSANGCGSSLPVSAAHSRQGLLDALGGEVHTEGELGLRRSL